MSGWPSFHTCGSCIFWHSKDRMVQGSERSGECHRFPPQPQTPHRPKLVRPITGADEWCGEFKGAPQ